MSAFALPHGYTLLHVRGSRPTVYPSYANPLLSKTSAVPRRPRHHPAAVFLPPNGMTDSDSSSRPPSPLSPGASAPGSGAGSLNLPPQSSSANHDHPADKSEHQIGDDPFDAPSHQDEKNQGADQTVLENAFLVAHVHSTDHAEGGSSEDEQEQQPDVQEQHVGDPRFESAPSSDAETVSTPTTSSAAASITEDATSPSGDHAIRSPTAQTRHPSPSPASSSSALGLSSSVDQVLDGADFVVETWVDRSRRRSLATVRGRSERRLGAEELNDSLRPDHLDKLRYVLHPDEAFGAIFSWDVVFNNSRALELKAWQAVAEEAGLNPPDMDDILRAEAMAPEAAIHRVFYWTADWGDMRKLLFRKCELYDSLQQTWPFSLSPGLDSWLDTLDRYGIKSVMIAQRPRSRVEAIVKRAGLDGIFTNSQLVTSDDECDSLEQMLLVAAIKLERPPSKCVVFTDKLDGITAAREVSARVVALIGAHPAYEIKSADKTVRSFDDLVVYHVRSLFAQEGAEFMDPETQLEHPVL